MEAFKQRNLASQQVNQGHLSYNLYPDSTVEITFASIDIEKEQLDERN